MTTITSITKAADLIHDRIIDTLDKLFEVVDSLEGGYDSNDLAEANAKLVAAIEAQTAEAFLQLDERTMALVRVSQTKEQVDRFAETARIIREEPSRVVFTTEPTADLESPAGFHPTEGIFVKVAA